MEIKHKVIHYEYDVFIREDEHSLPLEIEQQILDLGFQQHAMLREKKIPSVNGINTVEWYYLSGRFANDNYELCCTIYSEPPNRMTIWKIENGKRNTNCIDNGKNYSIEQGIERLKQLNYGK